MNNVNNVIMAATTEQINKYRWGSAVKTNANDLLHRRAYKLIHQVRDAELPNLNIEFTTFDAIMTNKRTAKDQPAIDNLMHSALIRTIIPMIVLKGFERYGVSRLTTTLTEFLAEMEPPQMEQVRGMSYEGPHCLAFRYEGHEYLAVRFLGYESSELDERAMSEKGWNCEFDVAGWAYIRNSMVNSVGECVRTEVHDSAIDEQKNNVADTPVIRRILYNLMLGWESGIFHEGPTDKAADARPILSSNTDRTKWGQGGHPPYRYVHLGPKGEKLHNEQRQIRERMNDPKFRLAHWFVRAHFRRIGNERNTPISAHYKSRQSVLINDDVQPTTVITV